MFIITIQFLIPQSMKGVINMIYSDYHMHTNYSSDSDATVESMIEKAISLGLKEIAITDHLDYQYPDPEFPFLLDYDAYTAKINDMKQKYDGKIIIRKGVEFGLQAHIKKETDDFYKNGTFDFVIGSTHCVKGLELYGNYFYNGKTQHNAYLEYFEDLYNNVKIYDCFNVYGHMDYVNRYGNYDNRNLNYIEFREIIDEILKLLIKKDKGIELNTSGIKYGLGYIHPKIEIIKRYKELGGEIITIGSDAHSPEYVASHIKDAYEILRNVGLKAFTIFEKQQPYFIDIPKI